MSWVVPWLGLMRGRAFSRGQGGRYWRGTLRFHNSDGLGIRLKINTLLTNFGVCEKLPSICRFRENHLYRCYSCPWKLRTSLTCGNLHTYIINIHTVKHAQTSLLEDDGTNCSLRWSDFTQGSEILAGWNHMIINIYIYNFYAYLLSIYYM